MSNILINTTRIHYPWLEDITVPTIDLSGMLEGIFMKMKWFFEGSLMNDFWTLFEAEI